MALLTRSGPRHPLIGLLVILLFLVSIADAHRSGCHRWHSCPSDSGKYICGDKGYCSQCPDNRYCVAGKPRSVTESPSPKIGQSPQSVHEFTGKVVGVTDGDTITVMHNNIGEKIRLQGIDCPERRQPFGTKATQFISELVFQQVVSVKHHGQDRYGRTIGTMFLPDGLNVNHELVKEGMCWWYRKYAPRDETLSQLEEVARRARLGLWVDPNPTPPWEWRKR